MACFLAVLRRLFCAATARASPTAAHSGPWYLCPDRFGVNSIPQIEHGIGDGGAAFRLLLIAAICPCHRL